MKNLTLENIIPAVHGAYHGDPALLRQEVTSITTDSRAVEKGGLFAAICGQNHDGHDYVNACFAKGALCCLTEREIPNAAGPYIVVRDTQIALGELAAFYRAQLELPVLGVTGSVGKTTAKEMVAAVLSQRFCTLKTEKNFNNDLGVPLTLFRLREEHEIAVVEMGISHFGEMRNLSRIVRPDMALITVIGHAHLEFLQDRAGVLRAKSEILDGMDENGVVFVNGDDDLLRSMDCRGRKKVMFGTTPDCAVYAEQFAAGETGSRCVICGGDRRIEAEIPAFGAHMIYAALAAAAIGIHMGLTDEEIAAGIRAYEPVGFRSRVERSRTLTVINDCYNANPDSCSMAIHSLAEMDCPGRRVCILGDMLELGENGPALHRELGVYAAGQGMDLVLCCGSLSRQTHAGAAEGTNSRWYVEKSALMADLAAQIRPGDTVLVKASRGMHFEEIVEKLKAL